MQYLRISGLSIGIDLIDFLDDESHLGLLRHQVLYISLVVLVIVIHVYEDLRNGA
jgi:hypothetical protein